MSASQTLSCLAMALSAPNVAMETCMTPESIQQGVRRWRESSADHVVSKESDLNNERCQENSHPPFHLTLEQKVTKAKEWLGARYLCAAPQQRRVRK